MKNVNKLLEENYTTQEIAEINKEAAKRTDDYMALKRVVANEIESYMQQNTLSFTELKEKLDTSTSQAQRIISGHSNFTLETLVKVGNLIGKSPRISFE